MQKQLILSVPEELYNRIEEVATATRSEVADIALDTIAQAFSPFPTKPARADMQREIAAYRAMHAELCKDYLGKFVAIHHGKVVDADVDPVSLHMRILKNFPNKTVLVRRVLQEPERVLHMRSPQLERPS